MREQLVRMTVAKGGRKRGTILTEIGAQKLQAARSTAEQSHNFGQRYTKEQLSEMLGFSSKTVSKIFGTGVVATIGQFPIDKQTLDLCFAAFNLTLERQDYSYPGWSEQLVEQDLATHQPCDLNPTIDCGEAPDVAVFYGRERELAQLTEWVMIDRCRTIAILGMGGIGKTALVTKLAHQLQPEFTEIVWRSLRNAPTLAKLLPKLIDIFSHRQEIVPPTMDISTQISCLLHYFRQERCLLILDNAETVLHLEDRDLSDHSDYMELFRRLGESQHQSCLLLTSREKPRSIAALEGEQLAVRTLELPGLAVCETDGLFEAKGLSASSDGRSQLVKSYSGNPLALNIVATTINELFDGDIDGFLATEVTIFSDIQQLLDSQFNQLDSIEQSVMYWLAIEREWVSFVDLHAEIVPAVSKSQLLGAVESLSRKSLVERQGGKFTQQAVVMEYVTLRLVDRVITELTNEDHNNHVSDLPLWLSHAWLKVQSPEYIQTIQRRTILAPLAEELILRFGTKSALTQQLQSLLANLKASQRVGLDYGGGNLINLFQHLAVDLTGYDFSNLPMWQADLQGATLHDVNLSGADLSKSLFTQNFGGIFTLAFSPDAKLLVMGEYSGDLTIWQVETKQLQARLQGYSNWIWAIAFSPDGQILASASQDAAVRLWDVHTGKLVHIFQADYHVMSIAYSPDGQTLAIAHGDGRIRFWDVETGQQRSTLVAHTKEACSVRYSPDGRLLATSSNDLAIKIWDVSTGKCLETLIAHTQRIWVVRFSPDGKWLATGSGDGTIKLWGVATWTVVQVLTGYRNWLFAVCFSPDSRLLLTGIDDNVRIWDIVTQQQIGTLRGHSTWISSIQFSADGTLVATGSGDRSVRLWDTTTWQELYRWQGYTNWIESVEFDPDGTRLVSGGQDALVRAWSVETGQVLQTFAGHDLCIWSVDYSPDGRSIASGSADSTVKLWDAETGKLIQTFSTHKGDIWSVQFSPDGRWLAGVGMDNVGIYLWRTTGELASTLVGQTNLVRSIVFSPDSKLLAAAGFDSCWRLWDVTTGELLGRYSGHTNWIWDLAFSPDGRYLATCSDDRTTKLWEVATGILLHTFAGHALEVVAVKFSPDGRQLATSSGDRSIKIWDVETKQVLTTLTGHLERVLSLSYHPDGQILASGSADETIKLWDLTTGDCLRTCKLAAPYLGMNITGATGLTAASIASLKMLGAIESLDT